MIVMGARMDQDPWLTEARQASIDAAEAAASKDPPPLDWAAVARRQARASRAALWAAVVIPLLLVGGSAGTWALVHYLRSASPEVMAVEELPPARTVQERAVVPRQERIAPPAQPKADPAPRRPRQAAVRRPDAGPTASAGADAGADTRPRTVVVLPGHVTGDDEVVIVAPKAKQKPLWTVEGYKRRGLKGFLKVDPVKAAPEGVENEVP
jgi:hypothetical protein